MLAAPLLRQSAPGYTSRAEHSRHATRDATDENERKTQAMSEQTTQIGAQMFTLRAHTKTMPAIRETLATVRNLGYRAIQISLIRRRTAGHGIPNAED